MKKTVAFLSLCVTLILVCGCSRVDNYDDCVLDAVKSNKNQAALAYIHNACQSKFPEHKNAIDLTKEQIEKVLIVSAADGGRLKGTVHNANNGIVVTKVFVAVGPPLSNEEVEKAKSDAAFKEKLKEKTIVYAIEGNFDSFVSVPYSVNVEMSRQGDFVWFVQSARGYRK